VGIAGHVAQKRGADSMNEFRLKKIFQHWQSRGCADCNTRLKSTDLFYRVMENRFTTKGVTRKSITIFCPKCAKKKGIGNDA